MKFAKYHWVNFSGHIPKHLIHKHGKTTAKEGKGEEVEKTEGVAGG